MPDTAPTNTLTLVEKIRHIQGPILVIGASGFVGANLMRLCLSISERKAIATATAQGEAS